MNKRTSWVAWSSRHCTSSWSRLWVVQWSLYVSFISVTKAQSNLLHSYLLAIHRLQRCLQRRPGSILQNAFVYSSHMWKENFKFDQTQHIFSSQVFNTHICFTSSSSFFFFFFWFSFSAFFLKNNGHKIFDHSSVYMYLVLYLRKMDGLSRWWCLTGVFINGSPEILKVE